MVRRRREPRLRTRRWGFLYVAASRCLVDPYLRTPEPCLQNPGVWGRAPAVLSLLVTGRDFPLPLVDLSARPALQPVALAGDRDDLGVL